MYHPLSQVVELDIVCDAIQGWSTGIHYSIMCPPVSGHIPPTGFGKVHPTCVYNPSQDIADVWARAFIQSQCG